MKKLLLVFAFVTGSFVSPLVAQTALTIENQKNKIEVTGSAEMEVVPDELYFNITLKEYYTDEKNQKDKVLTTTLEKQLVKAITDAGLSKDNLSIMGVSGSQNYVDKKKKPTTFLETKQYELKVNSPEKLDVILSKIDNRGLQNAYVARVDHTQKEEFKKQVKINALKAAKDKAIYLLEAIGQTVGKPMEIRELEENSYYPQPMYKSNVRAMAASMEDEGVAESSLEYKKIKLMYKMQVIFEIN
jgi:uncharacterized protein YggE